MKFSTTLTTAFFALFIFTATTTFANTTNDLTTPNKKEIKDKEDAGETIVTIAGRMAEVTDQEPIITPDYIMQVKVMKGLSVVAQATGNQRTLTLDLNDLAPGSYFFRIQTPNGIQKKLIMID